MRLRLPVERSGRSDWSPPVLTGQSVGGEGGVERGRGGEGLQEGGVVEPAAGSLHLLLVLAGQTHGVEDVAGTAGLAPGSAGDAEVELVAVVRVGVPGVFVGGTGGAGELVERTGGTAGSEQFLVINNTGASLAAWPGQHSPLALVSVVALALAGVEDEAASTGLGVSHAVRAEVELVTNCLVWVSEVTVGSGTAGTALGWLEILSP